MSYIDKSLGAGETVIARAQFPWVYNFSAWCQLLIPALVLAGLLSWASRQPDFLSTGNPLTWACVLVAIWLILGAITFLRMMIRKWTTEIGVTSHRFVEKYGLLSMRTNEIALPNIEGVKMRQSVTGRLLGYGTVRIEGTGVDAVTTPDIADPVGFVRAIQTAREHVAQRFEQQRAGNP
ncbi:MAG TPA: PH domain-containing protein [Rhizomicrobium sp.]|nr:PH domain-containing protein [Rhizomicrobium sp.]